MGIATLFERARWELALSTSDPDFKLNNSYRAFYARLIMRCEPDLSGLFEVRTSEADSWVAPLYVEPPCVLCLHPWAGHAYLPQQDAFLCERDGCGCLSREQA